MANKLRLSLFLAVLILFLILLNQDRYKGKGTVAKINGHKLYLEIADTDALRMRGLSGRRSLPQTEGMIFVFPQKNNYSFWMKEMYIPLDFIWVEDKTIVDLTENVLPPANFDSSELPLITPKTPVDKVIEINSGIIKKFGIRTGDKIEFIK